jgi:N-acetyltransferase
VSAEAALWPAPVRLSFLGIALEPLSLTHAEGLAAAAADGELWQLKVTSVPRPETTREYILKALKQAEARGPGSRLPFAVIDETGGTVLGSTSYHDILPEVRRLEIGYTWYARSAQRTRVNTICKWLLLEHAFDRLRTTDQGAFVVGWRTDLLNLVSQRAIERLGAQRDGVLRGQALRPDGSIRDTVCYSMLYSEWDGELRAHLQRLLHRSLAT